MCCVCCVWCGDWWEIKAFATLPNELAHVWPKWSVERIQGGRSPQKSPRNAKNFLLKYQKYVFFCFIFLLFCVVNMNAEHFIAEIVYISIGLCSVTSTLARMWYDSMHSIQYLLILSPHFCFTLSVWQKELFPAGVICKNHQVERIDFAAPQNCTRTTSIPCILDSNKMIFNVISLVFDQNHFPSLSNLLLL